MLTKSKTNFWKKKIVSFYRSWYALLSTVNSLRFLKKQYTYATVKKRRHLVSQKNVMLNVCAMLNILKNVQRNYSKSKQTRDSSLVLKWNDFFWDTYMFCWRAAKLVLYYWTILLHLNIFKQFQFLNSDSFCC
jgi:hypothetical protein